MRPMLCIRCLCHVTDGFHIIVRSDGSTGFDGAICATCTWAIGGNSNDAWAPMPYGLGYPAEYTVHVERIYDPPTR